MRFIIRVTHLTVARELKMLDGDGRLLVMRVEVSPRLKMLQSHQVAVLDKRHIIVSMRVSVVRFNDPSIVVVLVCVSCYLLLTGARSLGIEMIM